MIYLSSPKNTAAIVPGPPWVPMTVPIYSILSSVNISGLVNSDFISSSELKTT